MYFINVIHERDDDDDTQSTAPTRRLLRPNLQRQMQQPQEMLRSFPRGTTPHEGFALHFLVRKRSLL